VRCSIFISHFLGTRNKLGYRCLLTGRATHWRKHFAYVIWHVLRLNTVAAALVAN